MVEYTYLSGLKVVSVQVDNEDYGDVDGDLCSALTNSIQLVESVHVNGICL